MQNEKEVGLGLPDSCRAPEGDISSSPSSPSLSQKKVSYKPFIVTSPWAFWRLMLSFCTFQPTNQPTCSEACVKVANTPKVGMATLELPTVAETSLLQISHLLLRTGQELVLLSQNTLSPPAAPQTSPWQSLSLWQSHQYQEPPKKCIPWEAVAAPG